VRVCVHETEREKEREREREREGKIMHKYKVLMQRNGHCCEATYLMMEMTFWSFLPGCLVSLYALLNIFITFKDESGMFLTDFPEESFHFPSVVHC
jgi:hypothetical protein